MYLKKLPHKYKMYLKKLGCKSNMLHGCLFLCSSQAVVMAIDLIPSGSADKPVDSLHFCLPRRRALAGGKSGCLGFG
jgi:hypothetical protein